MFTLALETMTLLHPRWPEFIELLEQRLAATPCAGSEDKPQARCVLEEMGGFDIPATLEFCESYGGYCDCEIIKFVDC